MPITDRRRNKQVKYNKALDATLPLIRRNASTD
ncbi:MAG: hypothetical protein J5888_05410 [Bacteroidaceae bacterium]|nr:hypothetical protein [Bacteroidaceae bacterium]MBR5729423.1 hypothetical protein [Prevotella sp.]